MNAFGDVLAEVDVQPIMDLNNNTFHHASLTVKPDPADDTKALFDVVITEDVYGDNPTIHEIISDLPADINLNALPLNRVIAGGRTGGAFTNADIDNVQVTLIPEPSSISLLGMASLGLLTLRRRR